MDIEKLDINAVCFGILCNFTPVCGEERAKEAVELVRTLQAENEKLRAELKSKADLVFQQAKELDRRHLLLQEQEAELEQVKRERGWSRRKSSLPWIWQKSPVRCMSLMPTRSSAPLTVSASWPRRIVRGGAWCCLQSQIKLSISGA